MSKECTAISAVEEQHQEEDGPSVLASLSRVPHHDSDPGKKEINIVNLKILLNKMHIVCERRQGPIAGRSQPELIFTDGAGGGLAQLATKEFSNGFAKVSPILSFQGTLNLASLVKNFNIVTKHEKFDQAFSSRSIGTRAAAIATAQESQRTKTAVLVREEERCSRADFD
ncbi:hypothetical protein M433DRAFT_156076 [Acidomyces richmondensis BFW]|jgi:hypothetical protein|nr:MAG: hypothetical protein FE78DRAFT_93528 [Acidomyces sp. 'richmondensis']KYG44007.1 hypothetical protein M433DRAFT_156076 [Acidomyces richmondensis BFW]